MSALPFPAGVLSQHVIVLGKTRSGKSSKIRLIVEYLLDQQTPTCVVDPKGDWWGLKSSRDGKHAGFPVVIFGGEHSDLPLTPHSGAAVAELIASGNRPCLIDMSSFMVGERSRFFVDFAPVFFKTARGPRYLVIDEVHNFAPQGRVMDPDSAKMLHWANRLASEGSGKGITLIAASQRPQKVHKDFVTSCETLIATRVIHKLDRDAIKDWIDGCADPQMGRDVLTQLAGMDRSEAWVWSPEVGFGPTRITWPMFATYDSFRPQELQVQRLFGWADVDLEELRIKLERYVAEAEANDPAMLRKRIADLERQLEAEGSRRKARPGTPAKHEDAKEEERMTTSIDEEGLYQRFKARLMKEAPALIRVLDTKPEIEIVEQRETIELEGKSVRGAIAKLIARGFFDDVRTGNTVFNELKRTGVSVAKPNAYKECDRLTALGFLTREQGGYLAVAAMKGNIRKAAA